MDKYFATIKRIECADTKEVCIGYNNYLKSKHWFMLRETYIPKDMVCAVCNEKVNSLQLHHLTYKNIGNEQKDDLIPVCENCHKMLHSIPKEHIKSEIYIKPKKSKKSKHKRAPKCCKNCRYYIIMKIKGKKVKSEPYCNYFAKFNPNKICEHYKVRYK